MGRMARFSEEGVLDAALTVVSRDGPAATTIHAVASALGAPVGSIYHRFSSRDLILATLWLRTAERFQEGWLAALADEDDEDPDAGAVAAALHTLRWSRLHVDEARVLLLHRREELAAGWPGELGARRVAVRELAREGLRSWAVRRYGHAGKSELRRAGLAIVDLPYAAARRHLNSGEAPPPELDALIEATCRFLLDHSEEGPR